MKETGLDIGIDIGNFIAFVENPVISMEHQHNKGDFIQKAIQEFLCACKDKPLHEVTIA